MSDYIKREDAIKAYAEILKSNKDPKFIAEMILANVPSAEVVEVVRCKDCKWWDGIECKTRDIDVVDVDDFCSYGERKDGEKDECE